MGLTSMVGLGHKTQSSKGPPPPPASPHYPRVQAQDVPDKEQKTDVLLGVWAEGSLGREMLALGEGGDATSPGKRLPDLGTTEGLMLGVDLVPAEWTRDLPGPKTPSRSMI